MTKKNCMMCGKKVDWIAEVSIFPQNSNPEDLEDFYTMVCYACLMDLPNNIEVKKRLVEKNNEGFKDE